MCPWENSIPHWFFAFYLKLIVVTRAVNLHMASISKIHLNIFLLSHYLREFQFCVRMKFPNGFDFAVDARVAKNVKESRVKVKTSKHFIDNTVYCILWSKRYTAYYEGWFHSSNGILHAYCEVYGILWSIMHTVKYTVHCILWTYTAYFEGYGILDTVKDHFFCI